MDIHELHKNSIQQLNAVFQANKGDNTVTFEIVEFDKVKKIPEIILKNVVDEDENFDGENLEEITIEIPIIEEENQAVTRVSLPSRKLKVKISNELLLELEKMKIRFSLN